MPTTINPLRYPGAKRTLADYIGRLLTENNLEGCTFFEPYAGSAAVGLDLIQRGITKSLVLCEKDILIYAFWECVFRHTDELCEKIENTDISVETWNNLDYYRKIKEINQTELLNLGFAGLFFNRTNFSGILDANPIGGIKQSSKYKINCRFNKEKIIRVIADLSKYRDYIDVNYCDALAFMKSQGKRFMKETCFAYFDPPYYGKGKQIYRHYYTVADHIALANYVGEVKQLDWIISYDNAPFICGLYSGSGLKYRPFFLDYTCATKVRSHGEELLISNLPLPPFAMGEVAGI